MLFFLNFMAVVPIHSDFGAQENKICHCFHVFPFMYYEVMGPNAMILVFTILSFKPGFLSSLSPSSRGSLVPLHFLPLEWYHLHIRLLMFLPPILIPACNSSSLAFLIMRSAYRLNKHGDIRQPCHNTFSILIQSIVPYRVLTVAY